MTIKKDVYRDGRRFSKAIIREVVLLVEQGVSRLAERINGIIKTEFRLYSTTTGFEQTKALVDSSILAYNELRPHSSCDYLTPAQAHLQTGTLKKRWKKSTVASNESKMCNFKSSNPV